jgi:hypothetical protein
LNEQLSEQSIHDFAKETLVWQGKFAPRAFEGINNDST